MERKLIKSKIKVIDYLSNSNKYILTKIIYNSFENQENYISKIIQALKHSDNIKFYLAEDVLPKIILDEIKWLKYYNYDIKFIVSNEKIKNSLKSYSDDITVDLSIKSNIMEITDDSKTLYKFDKSDILELISLDNLLKDSSNRNNRLFCFFSDNKPIGGKREIESFTMVNNISDLKSKLEQNQDAKVAYVEKDTLNKDCNYLGFGSKLFKEIDFLKETYYQSIQDDIAIYINLQEESEQKYTILDNRIVKLNRDDIKTINVVQMAKNFQDFESTNISIDMEKEIAKYGDYKNFSINCIIEPPYIEIHDGYKISSRYDNGKSILTSLKNNILKNISIDSEIIDDNKLKNLVKSIKLFVLGKDNISLDIKELQQLSIEFGDSTQFKEVLRKYFDSFMQRSRQNFNTGILKIDKEIENLKSMLSRNVNSDSKEYKRLTEELIHLTNIKNDYNTKYGTPKSELIDFDKLVEVQSFNDMSSNKSLSRIVKSKDFNVSKDSIQHRLLKTITSFIMISQFVSSAVEEIGKLDIPNVGILYENESELGLVIKYEDELVAAKRICEKYNYKLFIERENLL